MAARYRGYQTTLFFGLDLAAATSAHRDFALEPEGTGGFSGSVITPQSSGAAQVRKTGAAEVWNAMDDDCDTAVDDGLTFRDYYVDNDDDGYGAGSPASLCADLGDGRVAQGVTATMPIIP